MKLVMFDIDGTLTQTDDADTRCYAQAIRDVLGYTDINTDWASYRHCSDSGILQEIFERECGRAPSPDEVTALQFRFVALLGSECAAQPFREISGAGEMLRNLSENSDVAVSVASGAWACSARVKLTSAGLPVSHLPAAFSDDAHAREEIMQLSLRRAAQAQSRSSFDRVVYVGDGVWDARAAARLGYRFIGIAADATKADRLCAEGAAGVFPDYANLGSFLAAVDAQTS
jgi:phosphoglycolate phosphatase-like HAD superfamily hydrolase